VQNFSQKKPTLVISLDGLSKDDLSTLTEFMDYPKQLDNCLALDSVNGKPFVSVQSVWAEILTGKDWAALGCPGYRRPTSSLNTCEVVTEDDLVYPATLASFDNAESIVVNMPLLKPNRQSRFWLSDGSLPIQTRVSPERLALEAPYSSYRAKPFPSTAHALLDLSESVKACLDNELQRLRCALQLMKNTNWQIAFIRITVFDMLAHLLGPDYLSCRHRLVWPYIKSFLSELDKMLTDIDGIRPHSYKCVISTFSHVPCRAQVNLSQVLAQGGFCQARELDEVERSELANRMQAVLAINSAKMAGALPLVSLTKPFDISRTTVASPVYGAIYLNKKDRFSDGIVADKDSPSLLAEVTKFLNSALSRELGEGTYVFPSQSDLPSQLEGKPAYQFFTPELVVSIDGVEFHDASHIVAIDHENHPRSTHNYNGFVWFSDSKATANQRVTTSALHQCLMEQRI
jgi:predicted AlkP superfamily phosphohydrolase/phosphomutase